MTEARDILSRDTHVDEPTLRRLLREAVDEIDRLRALSPQAAEQDTAAQSEGTRDTGLPDAGRSARADAAQSLGRPAASAVDTLPEEQINRMREAGKAGYLDMWNPAWDMLCNQAISAIRLQAQLEEARSVIHEMEIIVPHSTIIGLRNELAKRDAGIEVLKDELGQLRGLHKAALARKEGT